MSLQINEALRSGFRRTASREALGLVAVFVVFQAANTVIAQSFNRQLFEEFGGTAAGQRGTTPFGPTGIGETLPLVADLPLALLAVGLASSVFLAEALSILGVRMFTRTTTATVSTAALRDGLVLATLNGVVGGIITTVATGLGTLLLVIPGLFIAVSLFFVRQEVAVKNRNFVDAIAGSWTLTRGLRVEVFGLAALLFVINLLVSSPATVLFFIDPVVATVLGVVVGSIATVFGIAVTTRAYAQLQTSPPAADSTEAAESGENPPRT